VSSASFRPRSTASFVYDSSYYLFSTGADPCFLAPVQLPSGVKIVDMSIDACDSDATNDVYVALQVCQPPPGVCTTAGTISSFGAGGCNHFGNVATNDIDISNSDHIYFLLACNNSQSNSTKFRGVEITYKLQLSPAPAFATFSDVPTTHLYFRAIEALAASGLTAGCGGGNYCPDQNLTRGEMAKLLSNALGLSWGP
jgi:hypothetical protein